MAESQAEKGPVCIDAECPRSGRVCPYPTADCPASDPFTTTGEQVGAVAVNVWPPESWCAAINPDATHICDQPKGHEGDHAGPEMPTVTIDEPTSRPEVHDCSTCEACIHNGNRCCGCYDGVCCQEPISRPGEGAS